MKVLFVCGVVFVAGVWGSGWVMVMVAIFVLSFGGMEFLGSQTLW